MSLFSQVGKELPEFSKYLVSDSATECVKKMTKKDDGKTLVHFVKAAMNLDQWQNNSQIKILVQKAVKQKEEISSEKIKGKLAELKRIFKSTIIKRAESKLDKDPDNEKKRYELAKLYMHNHNHIAALALLEQADFEQADSSSEKVEAKIEKCKEKVQDESRSIGKVVRKIGGKKYLKDLEKDKVGHAIEKILQMNDEMLPVEAGLLKSYTASFYGIVNIALRSGSEGLKKHLEETNLGEIKVSEENQKKIISFVEKAAPIIKHSLKKMESMQDLHPNPTTRPLLYRGMKMPKYFFKQLQDTMKFSDPGFMSTSLTMAVANAFALSGKKESKKAVVFTIIDSKGSGVPIETLSHYKGEKEVLFAPNTEFTVQSILKPTDKKSAWMVTLVS